METDTFEKHIRTKLKEREISPSSRAWERISGELGTVSPSRKPVYLWLGIAASVVVVFGVGLFYFNGGTKEGNSPVKVVETNKKKPLEIKEEKLAMPFQPQEIIATAKTKDEAPLDVKGNIAESNALREERKHSDAPNGIEVAKLNRMETNTIDKELRLSEQIISDKVAELVTQVDVLEQYTTVTDAEVDSLLKRAQEEILKENLFKTNTTVDATVLLTVVEDELDQSFRDQIFNSLKAGFIKVRTAVADRNN